MFESLCVYVMQPSWPLWMCFVYLDLSLTMFHAWRMWFKFLKCLSEPRASNCLSLLLHS